MKKDYLIDMLKSFGKMANVRASMPGHHGKKSGAFFDDIAAFDITEMNATDDLYSPKKDGAVENSLKRLGENLSCNAVYLTGGATLALQSGIFLGLKELGVNRVICDRRAHISVINTLSLLQCEVHWLLPDENFYHQANLLDEMLSKYGKSLVIITSTDYYGRIQDISSLAKVAHKYNSLLLCDNAHGAHFAFCDREKHPKNNGADITADSFHKTLPALTSAAVMYSDFSIDEMLFAVKYFASTSPSYIVAASIDHAVEFALNNPDAFENLRKNVADFREKCEEIGFFSPKYKIFDDFRICLCHQFFDMREVYSYLEQSGIFCELSDIDHLVIIPSLLDTNDDFSRIFNALKECEQHIEKIPQKAPVKFIYQLPKKEMTLWSAYFEKGETVKTTDAENRTVLYSYYPYPPGIPVVCAGEIIDESIKKLLINSGINEVTVKKSKP